ncbi:DNA polymerase I-like [Ylistrum balloti]|uniref:DNA polymerase I-like n=1 Tax=Ylistrum balloti TaxID=509963 RepID=UPI002905C5F1|nr:DNA polymerase I-like [Ylistrum balloti]
MPHISIDGFEADDIIASLVEDTKKQGTGVVIISSDKDLFQLIGENIQILRPSSKSVDWIHVDEAWVEENYGIGAAQIHDYLALIGDSSDNIPGVAGIGPKTAASLLQKYKNLDGIFENLNSIKEAWRKKLSTSRELAQLSYTLVQLNKNIPMPSDFSADYPSLLWENVAEILAEHDIKSLDDKNKKHTSSTVKKKSTDARVHIVHDATELSKVAAEALEKKYAHIYPVFDKERALHSELYGIAVCVESTHTHYLPWHALSKEKKDNALQELKILFDAEDCELIFYDSKQALTIFQSIGVHKQHHLFHANERPIALFDILIAAWMISPAQHHYDLASLHSIYAPHLDFSIEAITEKDLEEYSVEALAKKSSTLLVVMAEIAQKLRLLLEETGMYETFRKVEMYVSYVLTKIEKKGIVIDGQYLYSLSQQFSKLLLELEQEIYELSGETFNVNSPKQLGEILFEKLELPYTKKTKTGNYSTDVQTLEFLSSKHMLPEKILRYRHINKYKNTYTDTLPLQIQVATGRVHTSLNQNGSETGRISSTNPALQNIPVRDTVGQQIRCAFISPKGSKLISADYSQIELVILAHLSQDAKLLDAFIQGVDVHTLTASILFQVAENDVTSMQRRIAKSINFGVIYGMSAFRLSNELKISQKEAKEFISSYFTEFEKITDFIAGVVQNAETLGYTTTILGRRRYHEHINSNNKNLKHAADRMAINSIIQGSAADIMKLAMISVSDALDTENLSSAIILQIHDELLLECPENEVSHVLAMLHRIMPKVYELSAPLSISAQSGDSWGVLK